MTQHTVSDVMTTDVRTVYTHSPVKQIADQLAAAGISALPVLDEEANLVGIVSEADLLHKITYQDDDNQWPRIFRRHRIDRTKAEGLLARDLMTAPPITISPTASVNAAATLMQHHGIKRLPVVNDQGTMVGIISRGDLVRLFVRPDEQIRIEIETDVLRRALQLAPNSATVSVLNGVATLDGQLQRKTQTAMAGELTHRVGGVINVVNTLTYIEDDTEYHAPHQEAGQPQVFYF